MRARSPVKFAKEILHIISHSWKEINKYDVCMLDIQIHDFTHGSD